MGRDLVGGSPQFGPAGVASAHVTKSILDMAGMLKAPEGKHLSVDDMNPWR